MYVMEIKIIGAGPTPKEERTPFIAMLYIEDGERKKYECTWPVEFIREFEGKADSNIEVAFFFVMGQPVDIHSIEKALKFCKA